MSVFIATFAKRRETMDENRTFENHVGLFFLCISIISFIMEIVAYKCDFGFKTVIILFLVFIFSLVISISFFVGPDNYGGYGGGGEGGAFF